MDYIRPERMFGVSTNNLLKNIGWAKKGILSFSNTPLNILSFVGSVLLALSVGIGGSQILGRVFFPELVPERLNNHPCHRSVLWVGQFVRHRNLSGIYREDF